MKISPLLILLLSWSALSAATVPPVTMELHQVGTHSYYVQGNPGTPSEHAGFISNAGVIVTDVGVIVIDALGTPALAHMLLEKIRALTPQPVVKVIVTHYHADHIFGLQVFKDAGAEIIAPHGVFAYLNAPEAQDRLQERRVSLAPWVNEDTRLVPPDVMIEKATDLSIGGVDLHILPLGAVHSEADLLILVKNDKVLYSGDMIFVGRLPFVGSADSASWLEVLDTLAHMPITTLVPGHGSASDDPGAILALTRDYLLFLHEHMGIAVENFTPFDEAYEGTDWRDYQDLPAFDAANRRNAYQVYLSLEAALLGK
jgi:glyoxylase-like metal-dependent hydrolase (beta-lactamase superfamily II)